MIRIATKLGVLAKAQQTACIAYLADIFMYPMQRFTLIQQTNIQVPI
jgi:hypothetical protein